MRRPPRTAALPAVDDHEAGTVQAASRRARAAASSSIGPAFGSRSSSSPSSRSLRRLVRADGGEGQRAGLVPQPRDAAEPAPEDLGHHPEVVGRLAGADPEAAVLARLGLAVDEDDHRADRRRPLDVAHVVALDPLRRPRRSSAAASSVSASSRRAASAIHSVRSRSSASTAFWVASPTSRRFSPALRDGDRDPHATSVGEVGRQVVGVGRHDRDEERARERVGRRVVLLEERAEHLGIGHVARALDDEVLAADELAVADLHDLEAGLVLGTGHPDRVVLGPAEGRHLLLLHRPLDGAELVARRPRPARSAGRRCARSCRGELRRDRPCRPSRKSTIWPIVSR